MKMMVYNIYNWFFDLYKFVIGGLMSLFTYMLPMRDMVLFVTFCFIVDVVIGYAKAWKMKREKFKAKIIWEKTMPRWLFSVIILSLLFLWDKVHHQDFVSTYYVGGYFLSGTVIASIIENALIITRWRVFESLYSFVTKKVAKETGEEIKRKKENL